MSCGYNNIQKGTVSDGDPVSPKSKNLKFQFDIMNIEGSVTYVDGMYRMFMGPAGR